MKLRILSALIVSMAVASCGAVETQRRQVAKRVGDDRMSRLAQARPEPPAPPLAPAPAPAPLPSVELPPARSVPLETFLVSGSTPPDRLKARDLTLRFRANVANARFECRIEGAREFRDCPEGDHHAFSGMAHGSTHQLTVRARSALGERDASPLTIAFVVDLNAGAEPGGALPVTAGELPVAGGGDAFQRSMQLGGFYGLVVPTDASVASYSSDRTYNGRLQILWRLDGLGSAFAGETCKRSFERQVDVAASGPVPARTYCEATPNRVEVVESYATPQPRNHVEIVRGAGERLIVAAFDAAEDEDPAEAAMGEAATCAGAASSGTSPIRIVKDFYGETQPQGTLSWCQAADRMGRWWWIGAFVHEGVGPDAVRLRGRYAASAELGIFSGQEFATRTGALLQSALVPLTPTR